MYSSESRSWVIHVLSKFWSWVVHVLYWILILSSTCTPLSQDLGQFEIYSQIYLICWMLDRVSSTCTTPHICLVFKVIFTILADCAKLMIVHLLLWIKILANSKLQSNLVGSTCTTPHISIVFNAVVTVFDDCAKFKVVHVLLWILIMMAINLIYGLLARKGSTCTLWILISGSTCTPLNQDLGQFTLKSDLFNLWNAG